IFERDQYGNWAGGLGYTVRQGFRVGGSAYYGPYLDRQYPYFFPGEVNPRDLPGSGYGLDVEWGSGHWNAWGELHAADSDTPLVWRGPRRIPALQCGPRSSNLRIRRRL